MKANLKKPELQQALLPVKRKLLSSIKTHKILRVTPAIGSGIADHVWSLEEIVALTQRSLVTKLSPLIFNNSF